MATAELTVDWLTAPFAPVSLEALNAKAAMLERLDNKYVVAAEALRRAVPARTRATSSVSGGGRATKSPRLCDGPR